MATKKSNGEGTIYTTERNGRKYYTGQVTIGIDENGKQLRKSFSGYKRSEVVQKMKEAQFYIDKNIYTSSGNMTFSTYIKEWLFTSKKAELAPRSFEKYVSTYENKIKDDPISRVELSSLTTLNLQKYFNRLVEKGESYNQVRHTRMMIKSALEDAVNANLLFRNPVAGVKIKKDETKKKYNILSQEEQQKFIEELDLTNSCDMLIYITLSSGLRLGEVLALKWEDFDGSTLNINKQIQNICTFNDDGSKTWQKTITELKTKDSYSTVPLPEKAIVELKKYKIRQLEHKLKLGKAYKDNDFIFTSDIGDPLDRKKPGRRVSAICKKLNIEHKTFHSLRHSYCTRLFEAGVPIKTVQSLMRHSNSKTTLDIYTHVMPEQKENAVLKLQQFL